MSEKKVSHTPGPWRIDGGKTSQGDMFVWKAEESFGGHGIAKVFKDGARLYGAKVEANARLIAAAPELLVACKDALLHAQLLGSGQESPYSNAEICELTGAAIAKAEGKE